MSLFDEVKDTVTVPEAAKHYGYSPNRSGYISCPFHSEKTPSLRLYERKYHCYGCGAHGSVVDFVKELFNLSPLDAARKIAADFGLHLEDDHRDRDERHHVREVRQLFDEWKETTLNKFDAVIRMANLADYESLTDTEVMAILYREAFEFWSDRLLHGSIAQQMDVFRDRKEVDRLCRMILQTMPRKSKTA